VKTFSGFSVNSGAVVAVLVLVLAEVFAVVLVETLAGTEAVVFDSSSVPFAFFYFS
jgi:hypothetical protein